MDRESQGNWLRSSLKETNINIKVDSWQQKIEIKQQKIELTLQKIENNQQNIENNQQKIENNQQKIEINQLKIEINQQGIERELQKGIWCGQQDMWTSANAKISYDKLLHSSTNMKNPGYGLNTQSGIAC